MPAAAELIVFPDVEQLVIDALHAGLAPHEPTVRASGRVPNPRPAEFYRIMRAGGPAETLVSENATILLEAWAQTQTRASRLLQLARAVLAVQEGFLFGVTEIGGPINLPDPTTEQVRYTQTFGVRARATAL